MRGVEAPPFTRARIVSEPFSFGVSTGKRGAALRVAWRRDPRVLEGCVFAHRSAEPGHRHALAALGVSPLLDLGMRLGEGSGAALAMPLLRAAARMLTEMASFEQAGVSRAQAVAAPMTAPVIQAQADPADPGQTDGQR